MVEVPKEDIKKHNCKQFQPEKNKGSKWSPCGYIKTLVKSWKQKKETLQNIKREQDHLDW